MFDPLGKAVEAHARSRFDLRDAIELLLGLRQEHFRYERGIRLFQFQTWILYPAEHNEAPANAGRIAAALLLQRIENPRTVEGAGKRITSAALQRLLKRADYQTIYDAFIASEGGWSSTFLEFANPIEFDQRINKRLQDAKRVADMIDFRVRVALKHPTLKGHISAAVNFMVRSNSSLEARTYWDLWESFKRSAVFNYIIERHKVRMRPPAAADYTELLEALKRPRIGEQELKRFFGLYSFIHELLREQDHIGPIPTSVHRVRARPAGLSGNDLAIAEAYKYENLLDAKAERSTANSKIQWR